MGTTYLVKYLLEQGIEKKKIAVEIEDYLKKFNKIFSTYDLNSEISRINQSQDKTNGIIISDEFSRQMQKAIKISLATQKAFDPTVSPLINIWGFGWKNKFSSSDFQLPNAEKVRKTLSKVGIEKIKLKDNLLIMPENMELDFSAISKGRAVDGITRLLKNKGIKNYLIEIGGEISSHGYKNSNLKDPDENIWKILIASPNNINNQNKSLIIDLKNQAIATSGDYNNFYEINGIRYSHTINPINGYPIKHNVASVSVIASTCEEADALATALMVLGEIKGKRFIQEKKLAAFMIYRNKERFETFLSKKFKQYVLTSKH